jgi:hypothetical protein
MLRPFLPIRPHVGANRPALGANHLRPERRDREIAGQMVDVDDHAMAALMALHVERSHAVGAHVGEVHGLDGAIGSFNGHAGVIGSRG